MLVPLKLGPDRRGGARHRDQARRGAARRRSSCSTSSRCRSTCRSTRPCRRRSSWPRPRSRTREELAARARRRASSRGSSGPARSARRSSRRREEVGRPGPHGLRAAVAPAVAVLQPDRGLRPAQGALRSDGRRVSAGRPRGGRGDYSGGMKAIVIGCGRVGSTLASACTAPAGRSPSWTRRGGPLAARRELAGRAPRRPRHGHRGARGGGHRHGRPGHRRDRRRQHEPRGRPDREAAVRGAPGRRPHPRPGAGGRLRGPRVPRRLADEDGDRGARGLGARAGMARHDVRPRRRRREGRRQRHAHAAGARPRGRGRRAAPGGPPARRGVRPPRPPRRRHRAVRAGAGGDQPARRHRGGGDRRRRGQHRHLPARQGALRRAEGGRARQRPAQPDSTSTCSASRRRCPRRSGSWR